MNTKDAIAFFGSQHALAEALKITQPAVALWGARPPSGRQFQIQAVTSGKLRADPPRRVRRKARCA